MTKIWKTRRLVVSSYILSNFMHIKVSSLFKVKKNRQIKKSDFGDLKENPQFYLHAKVLSDFITDNDELTPMEGEIVNVVNLGKEVTYDVKFTNGETVNMHPIDLLPIGNDSTKPPHFTLQDIVESDFHISNKCGN